MSDANQPDHLAEVIDLEAQRRHRRPTDADMIPALARSILDRVELGEAVTLFDLHEIDVDALRQAVRDEARARGVRIRTDGHPGYFAAWQAS